MFLGEFQYRIDQKGRVPIPPSFRKDLPDGLVLAPGPEKCIVAYSPAAWQKLSETINASSLPPSKLRRLKRAMFATAFQVAFDIQGRIQLPQPLRKYAGVAENVVAVGTDDHIELWEPGQWEAEKSTSQNEMWQILESQERR